MATNRYIGARYVPMFIGVWDNTREYEPLSIVSYLGDSYTSKGYVPIGIDITNTTYWAKTGDFNQQLANLEAVIEQIQDSLEEEIENIASDLEEVTTRVSTLEETVETMDGTVEQLSGDVTRLGNSVGSAFDILDQHQGEIINLQNNLGDYMSPKLLPRTVVVSITGVGAGFIKKSSVSVSGTGVRNLGIVGFNVITNNFNCVEAYIENDVAYATVQNFGTSQADCQVELTILTLEISD